MDFAAQGAVEIEGVAIQPRDDEQEVPVGHRSADHIGDEGAFDQRAALVAWGAEAALPAGEGGEGFVTAAGAVQAGEATVEIAAIEEGAGGPSADRGASARRAKRGAGGDGSGRKPSGERITPGAAPPRPSARYAEKFRGKVLLICANVACPNRHHFCNDPICTVSPRGVPIPKEGAILNQSILLGAAAQLGAPLPSRAGKQKGRSETGPGRAG